MEALADRAALEASPPAEVIVAELARRRFPDWCRWGYHILDRNGVDARLALNRAQVVAYCAERTMLTERGLARIYILKGRRGGISTLEQALNLHTAAVTNGARALTLAHDRDHTDIIFDITRYAVENFPEGGLPELGLRQTREFNFPEKNSRFFTGTAAAKRSGRRGSRTGRGGTLWRLHGSEFAYWDSPRATLNSIEPSFVPHGSVAVLETTASGFGTEAHVFWQDAKQGRNAYRPIFIPWWLCDDENYRTPLLEPDELGALDEDERLLVTRQALTLEQIKWRRERILRMGGRDDFFQEYPEDDESCWLAPGGMYFPVEQIRRLQQRVPVPIREEEGGDLKVYAERGTERVILGADTAEGVGGDSSTFAARAFPSGRLLRTFKSATIPPKEFAHLIALHGRQLGAAFLVIEKNAHGITVLRELRDVLRYPAAQIYHRAPLDQARSVATQRIGWATTEESKPLMLAAGRELFAAADQGLASPPNADAVADAFGVRRDESGRFNLNGRDMLVAEMLAWLGRTPSTQGSGLAMLEWMEAAATAERGA